MTPGEKRRIYRVQIKEGVLVQATVEGNMIPAELVDLNGKGAGLFVSSKHASEVEAAKSIDLSFSLRGKPKSVSTRARVAWSKVVTSEAGPGKHIGLQFLEPENLHAQLDTGFWSYFNRRYAQRVSPRQKTIEMQAVHLRGTLKGWLADFSPLGFALELPRNVPVIALPGHSVDASFLIPGTNAPAEFRAAVVYRLAKKSTNRLGLAIAAEQNPGFDVLRQALVDGAAAIEHRL